MMGCANQIKKRMGFFDVIDDKMSTKSFVPAMLRLQLRQHHQFGIRWVFLQIPIKL
jgi:hypothetical protein